LILRSAEFDPNGTGTTAPGDRKRQAYDWQGQFRSGRTIDREYIGVTHSLGSYLLFSTLNLEPDTPPAPESGDATSRSAHANENDKTVENNAVDYVFTRTSLIYFFANQVSLLELTDLEGAMSQAVAANPAAGASTPPAGTPAFPHFSQLMSKWAHDQAQFQRGVHPNDEAARKKIQVVAWSDPGDLLTWKVPNIGTVNVVNLYVQNAPHLFWVFESPTGAHDNYAQNKQVLRVMFSNTPRPHNQ
jgi:hypothetical protein